MNFEELKKYIMSMAKRTELNVEGKKIAVFEDGWYFENMRIVAKRFYWGVLLIGVLYVLLTRYFREEPLLSIYLPIMWGTLYALVVDVSLRQIKTDTKDIKEAKVCIVDSVACKAFVDVNTRILRRWIIFDIINGFALLAVLYMYTFRIDVFRMYIAILCAPVVFINCCFLRILFKKRVPVIQTRFIIQMKTTELVLILKDNTKLYFTEKFDFNLNGCGLVIVRNSKDAFQIYKSENIDRLLIRNSPNEVIYRFDGSAWAKISEQ